MQKIIKFTKTMMLLAILGLFAVLSLYLYWMQPNSDYPLLQVEEVVSLRKEVRETSSLAVINNDIWTTNDSGDDPMLYQISEVTGDLVKSVSINQVENYDWESLAQNKDHLYIFDCGNNKGDRPFRSVIKVAKTELVNTEDQSSLDPAGILNFTMADTPKEPLTMFIHDFDCEAATVVNDQMWFFSKNWVDFQSRLYSFPLASTNFNSVNNEINPQPLMPTQSLAVDGLITAADFNQHNEYLVLLGYTNDLLFKQAFIWLVPIRKGVINWNSADRYNLSDLGQWESILWLDDHTMLITSEASFGKQARIAKLNVRALLESDKNNVKR